MEASMDKKERQNNIIVTSMREKSQLRRDELLDDVMRVEREAWPEEVQATSEKFERRLNTFPDGFFLGEVEGKGLMGVSTAEIIYFDPVKPPLSWEEITDNGFITKTHKKDGNALYVVSVGVSRRVEELGIKGVGSSLVSAQKDLTKSLGLNYLVLGARVSGYGRYSGLNPTTTIEDYLKLKRADRETLDAEIRFYERNGLRVLQVVPDYMEDDPESKNYGAVMVWENPTSKTK